MLLRDSVARGRRQIGATDTPSAPKEGAAVFSSGEPATRELTIGQLAKPAPQPRRKFRSGGTRTPPSLKRSKIQRRGERRAVRSPPDAASFIHAPPPLD